MTPSYLRGWILELRARLLLFRLRLHLARGRPDPARLRALAVLAEQIETELLALRRTP